MGLRFAIMIPTRPRLRFIPQVLKQVREQTYPHWHCALVSDGPSPKARQLFEKHTHGDARFSFAELAAPAHDWGTSPVARGFELMSGLERKPDYMVCWDDDNRFYPDALGNIANALNLNGCPELLIVRILRQNSTFPKPGLKAENLTYSDVDTANFVARYDLAARIYPNDPLPGERGRDGRFFEQMVAEGHRICMADIPPIGRYDGLRPLATLRWKLGIPPLGISGSKWGDRLRFWLRKK